MRNRKNDKYSRLKAAKLSKSNINVPYAKRKKKSVWAKRIVALILSIILVSAAVMFGVIYAFDMLASGLNASNTVPPAALDNPETSDDTNKTERLNFLLLGTDGSNSRTDTIIFASFDFVNEKISLISIPRDTRVLINGKYHKINSCAVYGGEELLFDTLRDITGAPIHYYAKVSFSGFRNIIDILGGVDFDVPVNMYYSDPYQNLYINLKKGEQHLDGAKAEQLVRFRKYAEADIQRTRVQKDFIKALIQQKLTPEYILKAPSLYSEISKYITTNFTASDLVKNLEIIKLFQNAGDEAITTYEMPGQAKTINSASYWIHDVDKTLELFKDCFGGSGTSAAYDKYAAAESKALSSSSSSATSSAADDNTNTEKTDSSTETSKDNNTSSESESTSQSGTSSGNNTGGDKPSEDGSLENPPKDSTSDNSESNTTASGDNSSSNTSDSTSDSDTSSSDSNDVSTPPAWLNT